MGISMKLFVHRPGGILLIPSLFDLSSCDDSCWQIVLLQSTCSAAALGPQATPQGPPCRATVRPPNTGKSDFIVPVALSGSSWIFTNVECKWLIIITPDTPPLMFYNDTCLFTGCIVCSLELKRKYQRPLLEKFSFFFRNVGNEIISF